MVDDPIEAYLDRLLAALSGPAREVRRALAEAELHLYESAAELEASGLSDEDARAEAVRRMGPAEVAVGSARVRVILTPALRRRAALSLLLIGGVGGVAIGVAGAFGLIVRAVWGPTAIATAFPAGSYSAADCQRWMAARPDARNCLSVMYELHASRSLDETLACGLIGALALALYIPLRRPWTLPGRIGDLFDLDMLVGAATAAVAAVILLLRGIDTALVTHDDGVGRPFCLAAASTLAFLYLALRARRHGVTAQWAPAGRRPRHFLRDRSVNAARRSRDDGDRREAFRPVDEPVESPDRFQRAGSATDLAQTANLLVQVRRRRRTT
jgi:hypothetical protein